jgi:hypothetical protein
MSFLNIIPNVFVPNQNVELFLAVQKFVICSKRTFQSVTITFNHISLQHVFNIILPSCLSLICLHANIVLLGTSLVHIKLKGERMECNISQEQYFNSFRIALLFRYNIKLIDLSPCHIMKSFDFEIFLKQYF